MIDTAANLATIMSNRIDSGLSGTLANAASKVGAMNPGQIDAVAKDFESMFVGQMLEQMLGDSLGTEAFGDSETSDVYKGLMMDAYGKEITNAGGIGIADYVKKELLSLQEK